MISKRKSQQQIIDALKFLGFKKPAKDSSTWTFSCGDVEMAICPYNFETGAGLAREIYYKGYMVRNKQIKDAIAPIKELFR